MPAVSNCELGGTSSSLVVLQVDTPKPRLAELTQQGALQQARRIEQSRLETRQSSYLES